MQREGLCENVRVFSDNLSLRLGPFKCRLPWKAQHHIDLAPHGSCTGVEYLDTRLSEAHVSNRCLCVCHCKMWPVWLKPTHPSSQNTWFTHLRLASLSTKLLLGLSCTRVQGPLSRYTCRATRVAADFL